MCGIAGFSLAPNSKVNARHLAHNLLKGIESRGSHAAGYAYATSNGDVGTYKDAKPGSQLPLSGLPRRADTVILHTRFATQGSPQINNNNHPVVSKDQRIAVVHNGVISNDHKFREELGLTDDEGTVDSLVIPNLIAQQGVESLSKLGGYAAIAWVDVRARGVLNIARLKSSPVHFAWLTDGSFVFASTEAILHNALVYAGLDFGGIIEMAEGKHMTVSGGFIYTNDAAPKMTYDYGTYRRYSNATAGGHGTPSTGTTRGTGTTTTPVVVGATKSPGAVGSEVINDKPMVLGTAEDEGDMEETVDNYLADLEEWRARRAAADERDSQIAQAHLACTLGDMTDEQDDDFDSYSTEWLRQGSGNRMNVNEGYYLIDTEGGIEHATDVDSLETRLRWYAQMAQTDSDLFTDIEEHLNWINHIMDVGAVDSDGNLVSWVDDMGGMDEHESPAVHNLAKVREGVSRLATLKGA